MKKILIAFLLFPALAWATTYTTVTGTVTDSDGTVWANGTWKAIFYPTVTAPMLPDGVQSVFSGALDGTGSLSVSIPANNSNGGYWTFTACPNVSNSATFCQSTTLLISGSSQSISSQLSGVARAPRLAAGPGSYAYTDAEIYPTPTAGSTYWNVTSAVTRIWTGSAWQNSLPTATAQGQVATASGAGTTYTAVSPGVINVRTMYGGVPDGSTDNATAIANAVAAANAATNGVPTIYFDCNGGSATCEYNYGDVAGVSPFDLTNLNGETIECADTGVKLNYTGAAQNIVLGQTLVIGTLNANVYTVKNCTFVGGGTQTAGIHVNPYNVITHITGNVFLNFGNLSAWDIEFQGGGDWLNWITGNTFTDTGGTVKAPLVDAHKPDNPEVMFLGNTVQCFPSCSYPQPVGIWLNNLGDVAHNLFLGHTPAIRFIGGQVKIVDNHIESTQLSNTPTPAITYGDPTAVGSITACTAISDNLFPWAVGTGVPMVGPETPTSGTNQLSGCHFTDNSFADVPSSGTPYIQTNGGSGDYWSGALPANSSGPTPANPVFPTNDTSNRFAANWVWANTPYWGLEPPSATQHTGFGCCALLAKDLDTQLNAFTGGTVSLSIDATKYWTMDSSGNLEATTGGTAFEGSTVGVGSSGGAFFGASSTSATSACETSYAATTLNTAGTTTTTGLQCLPANSVIDAVVYRVGTTINGASTFTVGDGTTAARFCGTQSGKTTSGSSGICFAQTDQTGASGPVQSSAANVVLTFNTTPTSGSIRLIVFYHTWTPPTS